MNSILRIAFLALLLALPGARAAKIMVAAANPQAARAGLEVLHEGGSALDAAIAVQMVLNLVEPQSSGIGGGAFLLYWDAASQTNSVYDGRETAPAAARPDRFLRPGGQPMSLGEAIGSGLSVGVPGVLRALELAHHKHGVLPWQRLFEPAIRLAEEGFAVSPRLNRLIATDPLLRRHPAARAYFYLPDGSPLPVGHRLKNPELAAVLRRIADGGPDAFYKGEIAHDIAAAVAAVPRPGDLTEQDLAAYQAKGRDAVCGAYRGYRICGMPPPSSGGIAVLEMLGLLERFPMASMRPGSSGSVHLFAEAGRLAYADRDYYVGDPDFVDVPVAGLTDPAYLRERSKLIRPERSMVHAEPGVPAGVRVSLGADATVEVGGTSHLSIVDADGNAVAMTTSVESAFGSRIFVHGFLLNNELTDFSFQPEAGGRPLANRVQPGKRPRSAMAPTFVFDRRGNLRMTVGAAGGPAIINYVAKTLVGVLDWKLSLQQAVALPNMGSRNHETEIEAGSSLEGIAAALRALGHPVKAVQMPSGLHGIVRDGRGAKDGWQGGADPRREGAALGE
ncbi:MAG TPA: gamma-glutamyltransferase [Burkholderiales bacterium]|nr:gamma-glutamyltransferase [Burkholderiales bacterium]